MNKVVDVLFHENPDAVVLDKPGGRLSRAALHGAIRRQRTKVVKLLLEAGADPSQADRNGVPPLYNIPLIAVPLYSVLAKYHGHRL